MVCEEISKTGFQDGRCGSHLGFPIGTILPILDLEVILLLQCKFQLKWPNGLGGGQNLVFKMAALAAILDFQSA